MWSVESAAWRSTTGIISAATITSPNGGQRILVGPKTEGLHRPVLNEEHNVVRDKIIADAITKMVDNPFALGDESDGEIFE